MSATGGSSSCDDQKPGHTPDYMETRLIDSQNKRDGPNPNLPTSTSIQLLKLFPGKPGEPTYGQLSTVDLDTKPKFEALDYLWGMENVNGPSIFLDREWKIIRSNLHRALQAIRPPNALRVLWFDETCIDYNDISESTNHVPLGKQIYRDASNVPFWREPSADDSGTDDSSEAMSLSPIRSSLCAKATQYKRRAVQILIDGKKCFARPDSER